MTEARLGPNGPLLPRLGLGGGPLGNYIRAISDAEAVATVHAAWDSGVRYFDTAPFYGAGVAERRLGAALRGRPRDGYVLSTKVGRLVRQGAGADPTTAFKVPPTHHCVWDFSGSGVRRSLEESLERLGVDRVDLLLIHDPYEHWREAVESGYPALAELRDAGVVGAIGVGMGDARMLADFVRYTDIDMVMVSGRYTVTDQTATAELLPLCLEWGVWVVAVSLFTTGLLVEPEGNGGPVGPEADRVRLVREVCRRHDVPVSAVAMQYPFSHPAVAGVVVGCHTADQMMANVDAFRHPVPALVWADLGVDPPILSDRAGGPV
jgi:D-threo-aldose 1-dehydrogenase